MTKNGALVFNLIYHDGDVLEIEITASNGLFCGTTAVYVSQDKIVDFAEALRGFPSSISDSRDSMLGDFDPSSAGGGVSARFFCVGLSGRAYLKLRIETESGPDETGTQVAVISSRVEASSIDLFVEEVRRLAAGQGKCASLRLENIV